MLELPLRLRCGGKYRQHLLDEYADQRFLPKTDPLEVGLGMLKHKFLEISYNG